MHEHHDLPSLENAAVVIAGRDSIIVFSSIAVGQLLRYDPGQLVGQSVDVLVPEEFMKRHRAGWRRTWRMGSLPAPGSAVMIPVVCGDGAIRRLASHLLPINAPHGHLLAVAAVWVPTSSADSGVRVLR